MRSDRPKTLTSRVSSGKIVQVTTFHNLIKMSLPTDITTYTNWCGYLTLALLVLTIGGFIFKWGIRFRLVGITSFMTVLTGGLFALGLGLYTPISVPGSVRYSLVYDNGANQAVISVPNEVTESEIEATLYQAADNLFSFGRVDKEASEQLTIRVRTLLHDKTGGSIPLYLGQVKRSLRVKDDPNKQVTIFSDLFAQLPKGNG